MKSGTGFFLAVGVGLGVGLFANSNWWWQGLVGVLIITLMHILTKSEMILNSINNCEEKNQKFSIGMFFIVNVLINSIIAFATFGVVVVIKNILY